LQGQVTTYFLPYSIRFPTKAYYEAGHINIWDRESATLLHHVKAPQSGGGLTCLAWTAATAHRPLKFSTGHRDGTVHIWEFPSQPRTTPIAIGSRSPTVPSLAPPLRNSPCRSTPSASRTPMLAPLVTGELPSYNIAHIPTPTRRQRVLFADLPRPSEQDPGMGMKTKKRLGFADLVGSLKAR
jgi:WD40 repeat protein